jgi:hypothetical protein
MTNKLDELAKGLAQTTTRRQALKRFGACLAGIALACFGLGNRGYGMGPSHDNCVNKCTKRCVAGGGTRSTCYTYCNDLCGWD